MVTVGIIGCDREQETPYVRDLLGERGADVRLFDSLKFPADCALSLPVEGLHALYVRTTLSDPLDSADQADAAMRANWYSALMAYREKRTFLHALALNLEREGVRVVNPISASLLNLKPAQLHRLKAAGVAVPDTLVTNDPEALRAFARRHTRIIYKPLGHGAHARLLEPCDLQPERLERLRGAPVTFQEHVGGENVRVYAVGDRVVSASIIHTDAVDFRLAEGPAEPAELPEGVARMCLAAMGACGLLFSGIDLKREGDRWVLLECNTSPMFHGYDRKTGARVGPALADYLVG